MFGQMGATFERSESGNIRLGSVIGLLRGMHFSWADGCKPPNGERTSGAVF